MKGINSVWELLSFEKPVKPDDVIHKVRMNVLTLIEEHVLAEKPTVLIRVGRKGAHLVGPYDSRIEEKGFMMCTYRLLANNRFSQISPSLDSTNEPVILITDTIHTGKEMKKVLNNLDSRKIKVSKIFCYSKYQKGVDNLVKSGLIDEDEIIAFFSATSEEEYMEECKQLLVFFRSRIEPMDPDSCYDTYNLNKTMSLKEFERVIVPVLEEIFGKKLSVFKTSDSGFASNVQELSCYVENSDMETKIIKHHFNDSIKCKISAISIRFKLNTKTVDTDFTVIVETGASCDINNTNGPKECLKKSVNCCMGVTRVMNMNKKDAQKIICPACLELHISDYLLNEINNRIIKGFDKKDAIAKLKWRIRPYDFEE